MRREGEKNVKVKLRASNPNRTTKIKRQPVATIKVDPIVWESALNLQSRPENWDTHLKILSESEVIIYNGTH